MQLNQMGLVRQIQKEIEKVQLDIDNRDDNKLKTMELLGKREGLKLALEIISNPR